MDILKAEIAKKRKLLEEKKLIDQNKKYFKRSELSAIEREEYLKKSGYITNELNESSDKNKIVGNHLKSNESDEQTILPRYEVIKRLRERCEPILLFGETELESFKRLRQCEILEPEINRGFRNDFQEAMEKVDRAYLDEILKSSVGGVAAVNRKITNEDDDDLFEDNSSQQNKKKNETNKNENISNENEKSPIFDKESKYNEIQEMAKSMGKGNRELDMKIIMMFLQLLIKLWGDQLNSRNMEEKTGTIGKLAGATFRQTQVYLKPLLRKLKTKTIPEDILDSLTEIIIHLLKRNYLQASDAYLQMAIGNAPWPIGVTMVGIHARTGREKIFSKNVAHVMNDETQRKYIQALKRLMTKCQEYFPTDPSRCVEYAAFDKTL